MIKTTNKISLNFLFKSTRVFTKENKSILNLCDNNFVVQTIIKRKKNMSVITNCCKK